MRIGGPSVPSADMRKPHFVRWSGAWYCAAGHYMLGDDVCGVGDTEIVAWRRMMSAYQRKTGRELPQREWAKESK